MVIVPPLARYGSPIANIWYFYAFNLHALADAYITNWVLILNFPADQWTLPSVYIFSS